MLNSYFGCGGYLFTIKYNEKIRKNHTPILYKLSIYLYLEIKMNRIYLIRTF